MDSIKSNCLSSVLYKDKLCETNGGQTVQFGSVRKTAQSKNNVAKSCLAHVALKVKYVSLAVIGQQNLL